MALYFYRLGAAGGGAERMVCQLAGALAERGFRVLLVTWDPADACAFYPIDTAVQWLRLGFAAGLSDKWRRIRALRDALQGFGAQVLVGFVMSGDRTVYAAALLAGVRLVAAERNAPQMYQFRYGRWQRNLAFLLLRLADRITVQMPGFAAGYPRPLQARIVSIPNPVPAAQTRAEPAEAGPGGGYTLLAVSRLDADQKRINCLVSAFAQLASDFPDWRLLIVGDGPERASLQRQVVDAGLVDRVNLEPSTAGIFEVYARSHLFVIPSRWEGFPNALAEAMSHGLPAVGFASAAGVAELIGEAGWLAPGLDDPGTLAAALREAMANGAERRRRGLAAAGRMAGYRPGPQFDLWAGMLHELAQRKTT